MKLIFVSFFFWICLGCSESGRDDKFINMDSGSMMQSENLDTCLCRELDIDTLGSYYFMDEAYTGVCVEFFPNTEEKYIEKNILNGEMHGMVAYYDRQGNLLLEEVYEQGKRKRSGDVEVLHCNCTELEKVESNMVQVPNRYLLDGILYSGTCAQLYPESDQIYMKVTYKGGVLNGHTVYYNRDGSTLLIEKYEMGELISAVH